ncbi:hypothetical protein N2152v2_007448 [Parachlorella kessleri]
MTVPQPALSQRVLRVWQRYRLLSGPCRQSWPGSSAASAATPSLVDQAFRRIHSQALQQAQHAPATAAPSTAPAGSHLASSSHQQTLDYTTLAAVAHELRQNYCPSKVGAAQVEALTTCNHAQPATTAVRAVLGIYQQTYGTPRVHYSYLASPWGGAGRKPQVEQALQVDDETVVLKLRMLNSTAWLQLSWHSVTGHIASLEGPPERSGAAAEAYSFGAQLQAALRGLVLSGVVLPAAWERVLRLDFATRPSDPPLQQLHCEVMGRYSNLVLTDGAGAVAAAGYQVGGKMSSLRHVQAGKQYQLPPPAPGIDPDSCRGQQEWQQTIMLAAAQQQQQRQAASGHRQGSVLDGSVRAFRGVSPSLVRELCCTAQIDPSIPAAELSEGQWGALYAQWQRWLAQLRSGDFSATLCPRSGAYSVLGSYDRQEGSVLGMLGGYYSRLQAHGQFQQMKHRLEKAVSVAVQRLEKKVHSLQKQGGQSDKHLHTKKLADLLMSNLHRCSPGMTSLEAEDWDSPGTTLTIPLDPLLPPVECAEALYRQARKQRRAVDQVAPLIEEARAQLDYLAEVELLLGQLEEGEGAAATAAGDMTVLREVQAELVSGGYMKAPPEAALAAKVASKAKRAQRRGATGGSIGSMPGYREYASPSGLRVLIGRNSRQNDELTMRVANKGDVWMHARGVPGAHVLLRVPDGREVGDADIRFAADLAAWFSKARSDGKVEVTSCSPADISKPKGAKPGQVLVKRERVVVGRPHASAAAGQGDD